MANREVGNSVQGKQELSTDTAPELVSPSVNREFPQPVEFAGFPINIPGVGKVEIPAPRLPGQERGPYRQQVQVLEDALQNNGRPRGNVEPLDLGKDQKGNAYTMQRTENGIQITATKPDGSQYTVEINGRNGKLISATYKDALGNDGGVPTQDTINKIINTGIKLGVAKNAAPSIDAPSSQPPRKAPDL
jgi:hypothetical protein